MNLKKNQKLLCPPLDLDTKDPQVHPVSVVPQVPLELGLAAQQGPQRWALEVQLGSSAFAYPSVVAKSTPASENPKESSSDIDDKAADSYVIPAQVTKPQYSDVASKLMVKCFFWPLADEEMGIF